MLLAHDGGDGCALSPSQECRRALTGHPVIEARGRERGGDEGESHAKERDHLLQRLSSMRCSSDKDDSDTSTSNFDDDNNDNAPLHVNAYTEEGHNRVDHWKGKGAARK
ncbi:hypothetical protein D1007_30007 [Hordeum vulgare]|nr:hypothetical protein D1007_30007 [Hordeum vulgare]